MNTEEMVITTYENILQNKQKSFSPYFFQKQHRMERVSILIRYFILEKLKLTPKEALDIVTIDDFEKYKLKPIIKYVDKPIEYDKKDIKHLIYFAFPEIPQPTQEYLTINVYKEVLKGDRKNFPKNYFLDGTNGEQRAIICFKYLCEEILKLEKKDIPKTFLNGDGNKILTKYKLKILLNILFLSLIDLIETCYPNTIICQEGD